MPPAPLGRRSPVCGDAHPRLRRKRLVTLKCKCSFSAGKDPSPDLSTETCKTRKENTFIPPKHTAPAPASDNRGARSIPRAGLAHPA